MLARLAGNRWKVPIIMLEGSHNNKERSNANGQCEKADKEFGATKGICECFWIGLISVGRFNREYHVRQVMSALWVDQ